MGVGLGEVQQGFESEVKAIIEIGELDAAQAEIEHIRLAATQTELLGAPDDTPHKKKKIAENDQIDLSQSMTVTHGNGETMTGTPDQCPALSKLPPHVAALMVKASMLGAALPKKEDTLQQKPVHEKVETSKPHRNNNLKSKAAVDRVIKLGYPEQSSAVGIVQASQYLRSKQYEEQAVRSSVEQAPLPISTADASIESHTAVIKNKVEESVKRSIVAPQILTAGRLTKIVSSKFSRPPSRVVIAPKPPAKPIEKVAKKTEPTIQNPIVIHPEPTKVSPLTRVEQPVLSPEPKEVVMASSAESAPVPKPSVAEKFVYAAAATTMIRIIPRVMHTDKSKDVDLSAKPVTESELPKAVDLEEPTTAYFIDQEPQNTTTKSLDIAQKITPNAEYDTVELKQAVEFIAVLPSTIQEQFDRAVTSASPEKVQVIGRLTARTAKIADKLHNLYDTELSDTDLAVQVEAELVKVYSSLMRELGIAVDDASIAAFVTSIAGDNYAFKKQAQKAFIDPMRERQIWHQASSIKDTTNAGFTTNMNWLVKIMVRQAAEFVGK